MIIITTASYCGTGSSAITDFFSEVDGCISLGDYEFRFAQDPDGLSDLEYNIVQNNHRLNTGEAIKRYKRLVKRLNATWYAKEYKEFFGDDWMLLSNQYISDITKLISKTWWHQDQIDHGEVFRFIDRLYNKLTKIVRTLFGIPEKDISLLSRTELGYFTYLSEEEFLAITRKYTSALFENVNKKHMPFLMVDQLVPPSNISRYSRYFEDIVVFIVDRDPRDLYIRFKSEKFELIPISCVEDFCKWYRLTREHRKHEKLESNVCYVQFEDMIYNYEEMRKKLLNFVGLDVKSHIRKCEKFNPVESIRGTNLSKNHPEFLKDINYIEKELPEYIYDFGPEENLRAIFTP